jgi:hypothetical protein
MAGEVPRSTSHRMCSFRTEWTGPTRRTRVVQWTTAAVVTPAYVRERWAPLFELMFVDLLIGDLHQVMLVLRHNRAAGSGSMD